MNPALFLLVLRARFGLFSLAVCLTVVAAAAVTLILPKTYRATSYEMKRDTSGAALSYTARSISMPRWRMRCHTWFRISSLTGKSWEAIEPVPFKLIA